MTYKHLTLETGPHGVQWILINRPKALNALNSEVIVELATALKKIKEEASVRVVVLSGEGEKAFRTRRPDTIAAAA